MYPEENMNLPEEQKAPEYNYSKVDTIFAWLSLIFGFCFCKSLPVSEHPFGGFLLILALFITGFVVLRIKKVKPATNCILAAVSALVIGAALLLTNTVFLVNLSFAYALATFCYFICAALGNRLEDGFSDYVYVDYFKALILLPFSSLVSIFKALSNKTTKKGSQILINTIIGIGIAIIPTVIVFLFLSYDKGFTKILNDLFSFNTDNFSNTVLCLIWTLPLGMYGFGLYAASLQKKMQEHVSVEICKEKLQQAQILPHVTAAVAVMPILFLYVVFFISQWQYFVSGFTGVLPESFSYAEYARQGFFELCAVSVINLLLIVAIAFAIKRKKAGNPVVLKIVTSVFCLCTLVLISTAVAKLVMYIEYYGLTPKRIYAMWLMILIGVAFVIIALGQFVSKIKVVAICFTASVIMFAGLALCNVNAICAQYNVNRYLDGSLETLDMSAMDELGDSAIPSLVKVVESMDDNTDSRLKKLIVDNLKSRANAFKLEDFSIFQVSVPYLQAKAALADYIEE